MNCSDSAGRVPAGPAESPLSARATSDCYALAFGSVRLLLRAGEALRQTGYDVLVVPRRIEGCGVLLLVEQHLAAAALQELAGRNIGPVEVMPYQG